MLKMINSKEKNDKKNIWVTIKSVFSYEVISKLLSNERVIGVRINISKENNIERMMEVIKFINTSFENISVMLDMGGCKQRIHLTTDMLEVRKDRMYRIRAMEEKEEKNIIYVNTYVMEYMNKSSKKGDTILISDGWQQFEIIEIAEDEICCIALFDCTLYDKRGISVKGLYDQMEQNYEEDIKKINRIREKCQINYIAISFADSQKKIENIRKIFHNEIMIISKIESMQGIRNLINIVEVSDLVMIARGDLLVEISYYALDMLKVQDLVISCCDMLRKNYIIATRLADSLETCDEMTTEESILLSYYIGKYKSPCFLLANETSFSENKAIFNLNKVVETMQMVEESVGK